MLYICIIITLFALGDLVHAHFMPGKVIIHEFGMQMLFLFIIITLLALGGLSPDTKP